MKKAVHSDRTESAHKALRLAILERALIPGTKLPEDEIGRLFGMSRTLARATLTRLHAQGLVELAPKRTATVAVPTIKEAREAFAVRFVLEKEAVRLAAEGWSAKSEQILRAHVQAEDEANKRGDVRASTRLAGEFHLKLAELSQNETLLKFLTELVYRCSLIIAAHSRPHSAECAINEHSTLIEALKSGDVSVAQDHMCQHLGAVEERALLNSEDTGVPSLAEVLGRYAD